MSAAGEPKETDSRFMAARGWQWGGETAKGKGLLFGVMKCSRIR